MENFIESVRSRKKAICDAEIGHRSATMSWLVHFSYERYMENQIRANFGFDHTHLKLVFKKV